MRTTKNRSRWLLCLTSLQPFKVPCRPYSPDQRIDTPVRLGTSNRHVILRSPVRMALCIQSVHDPSNRPRKIDIKAALLQGVGLREMIDLQNFYWEHHNVRTPSEYDAIINNEGRQGQVTEPKDIIMLQRLKPAFPIIYFPSFPSVNARRIAPFFFLSSVGCFLRGVLSLRSNVGGMTWSATDAGRVSG